MPFLSWLSDWGLFWIGYGIMIAVLAETILECLYARKVAHKAKAFTHQLSTCPPVCGKVAPMMDSVTRLASHMLQPRDVVKGAVNFEQTHLDEARARLLFWYTLAPLLGLFFTATQLAMALPGAFDVIQSNPSAFFRSIGVAVGTTALGILSTILATWGALSLDKHSKALEDGLQYHQEADNVAA